MAIPFLAPLFGKGATAGAIAPAAATAAGLAGTGKLAATAGGLGSLMGAGAAGGALGLLSNPFVAMGIGSMLPSLLGGGGGDEEERVDIPENVSDRTATPVRPIMPTEVAPNADLYRPGFDPEQTYFRGRFYAQGGPVRGYAQGGLLRSYAAPSMMGYGPIRMQEGGIASLAQATPAPSSDQSKALVLEAARVIRGMSSSDPRAVLGQFMAVFGQAALEDLIGRVESGEMDRMLSQNGKMVEGQGDGMSDEVPANIDGQGDVRLSDGEFVVPADVVSGLGNGSSDAGARQLEEMMARVRAARTGTTKQAPAIEPSAAMPS